jgi:membrane protease YdiL (CAAX protease family)
VKERLRAADYRFIGICLALLAGSVWYSAGNFYRAFPEASIDFRVSRGGAQQLAEQFLAGQGYRIAGYRDASSFAFDDDAKTFLEREAGLEKANRLMSTRVPLWRWSFRWFRPQQKEEFRADITPAGNFAAFDHEIAEDAARPEITAVEARALAEEFLRARAHRDPASLDFVETSSVTRPHRVDRVFTWKERDFDLHDATNRLEVTLLGNEVGGYSQYLKVPEQWTRDYQRLRSRNNEAQIFDTLALAGLMIGLMVVLVTRVRRQDLRWRRAAVIGVVGMALSLLSSLNEFPLAEFGYPTADGYASFVTQRLLQAVLGALAWGGALFVIAAGAEVLYREGFPAKISLGRLFSLRGLRTRRFLLGSILGVTLCAIFIAYQTVFYIVAYRYGAWSPADVPYSDLLNTKFPWLFVLFGGYLPAISEEFLFRMFAIPFLRKLVRWLPAAVVLAGFIWGFGHASYPQQPFFIRGVEVGIGGVALGLIMLRWGILPTLVWHYSVDAMYSAMLLLRSHSLYFKLSGAASAGIFVVPILAALVAYWRSGGFEPETGLLNGDEAAAAEVPAEAPRAAVTGSSYRPLSGRRRLIAMAIFAGGLATALIPTADFGGSPRYKLTGEQARSPADVFLREQGVDPGRYLHVTYPDIHWGGDDSLAARYFLERRTLAAAEQLFERYRPVRYWATRYFKPLEKEELLVTVHPESGKVMGFSHQVPEDKPGADAAPDAARRIAAVFAAARGLDVEAMDLKESTSEKRKARRDYSLVWEARTGDPRNVDEARYRVAVAVAGDGVSSLRSYWNIPESFKRARERQNFISIAVLALTIAVTAAAVVFGLWVLIHQVRQGLVPWRRVLLLAVIPALMTAIGLALSFEITLYRSYQTFVPFTTFVVTTCVVVAMGVAFGYVLYGAEMAFLLSFFPESVAALRAARRRVLAVDAVVLLLLAIGLWTFCHQLSSVLSGRFHAVAMPGVDGPALAGLPAPAVTALANVVRAIFTRAGLLAVLALAVRQLPRRWMLAPLTLLAACPLVSGDVRTSGEFALEYLPALIGIGCALAFCTWFARDNYLAYAVVLGMGAAHSALAELLGSGNAGLEAQGWVAAGVIAAGIAWAVGPGVLGLQRGASQDL